MKHFAMIPASPHRPSWRDRRRGGVGRRLVDGAILIAILFFAGCVERPGAEPSEVASNDRSDHETVAASSSPDANDGLAKMRVAVARSDWKTAWTHARSVLVRRDVGSDVLAEVAQVAHATDRKSVAIDLMVQACRGEAFADDMRIDQTLALMAANGRTQDIIELLEAALEADPSKTTFRRKLHDLYWGTEQFPRAVEHGRQLVRDRRFDAILLLSLGYPEVRNQDADALIEMARRNPADPRPLVAKARIDFDRGDLVAAEEQLDQILKAYPSDGAAVALRCRVWIASGQYDKFEAASDSVPEQARQYPTYWISRGDWFRHQQRDLEALQAYREATRRDGNSREAWRKLNFVMESNPQVRQRISDSLRSAIRSRVQRLGQLSQLKNRFDRTGKNSQALAVEVARTLSDLGRPWEAEAWAALATTLPVATSDGVNSVRKSIVADLADNPPWQRVDQWPELSWQVAGLALADLEGQATMPSGSASRSRGSRWDSKDRLAIRFENQAAERNLDFFGRTGDDLGQPGVMLHQTLGCGGGATDYDLDGWCDLYLMAAGGTPPGRDSAPNALMRNHAGRFWNVSVESASGDTGFGQGVSVGDVNQDGFDDLLLLNYGANGLLINQGDGTFADHREWLDEQAGLDPTSSEQFDWSTSGAIADIDGDALPDMVVVNYCDGIEPAIVPCPDKDGGLTRACGPLTFAGASDQFFVCDLRGRWRDATDAWTARQGESPVAPGRGLGIVVGRLDGEPGIDVFVANDMSGNHYWSPAGSQRFSLQETALFRGLASDDRSVAQGSMGIAADDFDQDGDTDLYVTNFANEYNTYHEQQLSGLWRDQTADLNLDRSTLNQVGFGCQSLDADNDGQSELLVVNGHVDSFDRGDASIPYAQPIELFRRGRDGRFERRALDSGDLDLGDQDLEDRDSGDGYLGRDHIGRALWTADINRDGLPDWIATHQSEPVAVLVNRTEPQNHWIELQLVGTECERTAIGAKVEVRVNGQTRHAQVVSGDGYLCANQRLLRLGLGSEPGPCEVEVRWPSGDQQTHADLEIDRQWLIVQGNHPATDVSLAKSVSGN